MTDDERCGAPTDADHAADPAVDSVGDADDAAPDGTSGGPDEALGLDDFAAACDLTPTRIERFVVLGILEPAATDTASGVVRYTFTRTQQRSVARIQRLHHGLDLPYRAVGVVTDLLDRIEALEAELRRLRR